MIETAIPACKSDALPTELTGQIILPISTIHFTSQEKSNLGISINLPFLSSNEAIEFTATVQFSPIKTPETDFVTNTIDTQLSECTFMGIAKTRKERPFLLNLDKYYQWSTLHTRWIKLRNKYINRKIWIPNSSERKTCFIIERIISSFHFSFLSFRNFFFFFFFFSMKSWDMTE